MTDPERHPTLVAWQFDADDTSCVVFARTALGAARLVPFQTGFSGYSVDAGDVYRVPKFDLFAPGPVPISALLADGWHFECHHCYHMVTEEGCEDCGDPCSSCEEDKEACDACENDGLDWVSPDPVIRDDREAVYCSQECADAADAERLARKERKKECLALCREVLVRYPGAEIGTYWPGIEPGCERIDVKVPGLKYRASWRAEMPDGLWINPGEQDALDRARCERRAVKEEP